MTQIKVNGNSHAHTNGNGHANGHHAIDGDDRPHPQTSFSETTIDTSSFFGKLRKLYSEKVLKTQLEQLKHQGSYDAFKLKWHPAYDVRPLKGGKTRVSGTSWDLRDSDVRTSRTEKLTLFSGRRNPAQSFLGV